MTRDDLIVEFDKYNSQVSFSSCKKEIEEQIIRTEYSKGPYHEITPFSYQRFGFKQGRLVKDISRLKDIKKLYVYGFDSQNRIIEVKQGVFPDRQDKFYHTFIFHEGEIIKHVKYSYFDNSLIYIHFYYLDENGRIVKSAHRGSEGGREETYIYKNSVLDRIHIKSFDRDKNELNSYEHIFEYDELGNLKSITHLVGYEEVIYSSKCK